MIEKEAPIPFWGGDEFRKHRGLCMCSACGSVLNTGVTASKNILQKEGSNFVRIGNRERLKRPIVLQTG